MSFLEYALMAAIALIIFGVVYAVFPNAVSGLFNKISNALGSA